METTALVACTSGKGEEDRCYNEEVKQWTMPSAGEKRKEGMEGSKVKKRCWWERLRSAYFTCITGRHWELWRWGHMMKWCRDWPADVWGSRGTAARPPPLIICGRGADREKRGPWAEQGKAAHHPTPPWRAWACPSLERS